MQAWPHEAWQASCKSGPVVFLHSWLSAASDCTPGSKLYEGMAGYDTVAHGLYAWRSGCSETAATTAATIID